MVRVRIPKLTEDGKQFQVRGKGLPNVNDDNSIGSLIIRIKYEVPTKLTDKQLDLLEEFYELEEEKKQKH
jgi:molecular chaperone DnaJ